MSKDYYFPKFSDFHIGFEYECESTQYPDKNNWHPEIFHMNDSHIKMIRSHMAVNKIRVKKLNSEAIIELGGLNDLTRHKSLDLNQDEDDNCHYRSGKTFRGLSSGDDKKLHIYYDPDRSAMHIWYRANNGFETTLFDGEIKNVSEFRVLLGQLNIKYDE